MPEYAPLEITPMWSTVNDELIELVDRIPDDKMNWSPKPELWNFRGTFLHIITGRHGLTGGVVQDGRETPNLVQAVQTSDGIKEGLRHSWERMGPFLADPEQLARAHPTEYEGQQTTLSGYWLAFGLLEHDIHHRADIYHYLGMLGIEHPEPDSIARKLRTGGEHR